MPGAARQRGGWALDLQRRIAAEQLLLASSTTDGKGGGDLRNSSCAVKQHGSGIELTKSATVMSYGAQADAVLATARRSPDAAAIRSGARGGDEGAIQPRAFRRLGHARHARHMQLRLHPAGHRAAKQVFADPYQLINARTVLPMAHLTWSAVWAGIAAGAVERARLFVRGAARNASGQLPPGAAHLTRASASLRALRGMIASAMARYEAAASHADQLDSLDFQSGMNMLKVNASEMAIATVMSALQATGLSGYRNDAAQQHRPQPARRAVVVDHDQQRSHSRQRGERDDADARFRHRCVTEATAQSSLSGTKGDRIMSHVEPGS